MLSRWLDVRIFLSIVLMLFMLSAGAVSRDSADHFFDQSLGDFSEELELAREEGKTGILIMFEMDECPFCHRMKDTVLNQSEVQEYYKQHFLIFTVDIEGDVAITDFQGEQVSQKDFAFKQFRVRATPVFGFFDLEGKLISRFTGATRDAQEFLWLGEYVVNGEYKKISFSRYKRQKRKEKRAR
ncbi:MAG: thioredoxin [Gammaproteobacteria bacterium (ex Lamellibrachia satsuma)]|nr:MAG: thioredoxin fold domain-containing protein [Gammaproteobacteria bacterium (ex Lamellibrachia satsuma)]RRS36097.1 MAG: thioredoxin [Gammaproteobacteria bacterium (ex Lamellibrachia satsuma)]RRS37228.1 MAG: thioredoxin [Gammaproteobacteria bacterium (ex Lamellibrachia satsuma)]